MGTKILVKDTKSWPVVKILHHFECGSRNSNVWGISQYLRNHMQKILAGYDISFESPKHQLFGDSKKRTWHYLLQVGDGLFQLTSLKKTSFWPWLQQTYFEPVDFWSFVINMSNLICEVQENANKDLQNLYHYFNRHVCLSVRPVSQNFFFA